ncbi:MAG: transposase [Steroidobacteraceae bacterium]
MDTSTAVVGIEKAGRRKAVRRLHTLEQKLRVVAEANVPGVSVAEVARRHGLNANLVFGWRRQQQLGVLEQHTRKVKLLPVRVSELPAPRLEQPEIGRIGDEGRIEIILAKDIRVAIIGTVAAEHIVQVLTMLRRSA